MFTLLFCFDAKKGRTSQKGEVRPLSEIVNCTKGIKPFRYGMLSIVQYPFYSVRTFWQEKITTYLHRRRLMLAIVLEPYWSLPFPSRPGRVPEPGSFRAGHSVYYSNRLIWIRGRLDIYGLQYPQGVYPCSISSSLVPVYSSLFASLI